MSEYVGFDVSNEEAVFCVKDASGKILARGKVATDPRALFSALREHCLCPGRIVVETGTLSGWLVRALGSLGVAVEVILHRMLITGEAFRWPEKEASATT